MTSDISEGASVVVWFRYAGNLDVVLSEVAAIECDGYCCAPDVVDDELIDLVIDVSAPASVDEALSSITDRLRNIEGLEIVSNWAFPVARA